jgi:AbrB family looped-hinge helix DNA binding protein
MAILKTTKGYLEVRRRAMPYSKITSKGQMTIPADARRKYGLEDGSIVVVEEREEGLLLKRAPDIIASAGALSGFADASDVIQGLVKSRSKAFR